MAAAKWTLETSDTFQIRLGQIDAIIAVLISNIYENEEREDGRPTDEVIFLSIQHVLHDVRTLEAMSYEYHDAPVGELSLRLMWARAHLQNLHETFDESKWKTCLSDKLFCGSLSMVERLLEEANQEVRKVHAAVFQKAA